MWLYRYCSLFSVCLGRPLPNTYIHSITGLSDSADPADAPPKSSGNPWKSNPFRWLLGSATGQSGDRGPDKAGTAKSSSEASEKREGSENIGSDEAKDSGKKKTEVAHQDEEMAIVLPEGLLLVFKLLRTALTLQLADHATEHVANRGELKRVLSHVMMFMSSLHQRAPVLRLLTLQAVDPSTFIPRSQPQQSRGGARTRTRAYSMTSTEWVARALLGPILPPIITIFFLLTQLNSTQLQGSEKDGALESLCLQLVCQIHTHAFEIDQHVPLTLIQAWNNHHLLCC